MQRYHNIKAELESQQMAERARAKKGFYGGLLEGGKSLGPSSPRRSGTGANRAAPASAKRRSSGSVGGEALPRWQ